MRARQMAQDAYVIEVDGELDHHTTGQLDAAIDHALRGLRPARPDLHHRPGRPPPTRHRVSRREHRDPSPVERTYVILLLARTHIFPADQVGAWHLDHHPKAVATARTHIQRQLTVPSGLSGLVTGELVERTAAAYGLPPGSGVTAYRAAVPGASPG
ncbi:hypothetical protein ABT131_16975 [Streptomyces sp900105245]|uniref:hypothetical protein n=1 Tax=Streptomyces sp. 900105245 TaxID=3154379 RepID=UPI003323AF79